MVSDADKIVQSSLVKQFNKVEDSMNAVLVSIATADYAEAKSYLTLTEAQLQLLGAQLEVMLESEV